MRKIALVVALIMGSPAASLWAAQPDQGQKLNIERGLQSQYPPTKLAGTADRLRVAQFGTVLVVEKDGMGASLANELVLFGNNYKDGRIKHSLGGSLFHTSNVIRDIQAGERVYLLKTEVKDTGVVLNVQACEACDGSPMDFDPMPYRAAVTFQFPKGYLNNTDFRQIQQAISEVFSFAGGPNTSMQPNPEPQAPAGAQMAPQPPPAPQSDPVKIGLGQTMAQVVAGLGQPDKVVDLGSKKIYLYKDLKVTFADGRVSDVQ